MGISDNPDRDVSERDVGVSEDDERHREMPPEPIPSPGEKDRAKLGQDVSEQAP